MLKLANDLLSNQRDENELKIFSLKASLLLAFMMLSCMKWKRVALGLTGVAFP